MPQAPEISTSDQNLQITVSAGKDIVAIRHKRAESVSFFELHENVLALADENKKTAQSVNNVASSTQTSLDKYVDAPLVTRRMRPTFTWMCTGGGATVRARRTARACARPPSSLATRAPGLAYSGHDTHARAHYGWPCPSCTATEMGSSPESCVPARARYEATVNQTVSGALSALSKVADSMLTAAQKIQTETVTSTKAVGDKLEEGW